MAAGNETTMTRLMLLLLVEGATFIAASLVHRGVLIGGYEHDKAAVAETVIGAVLLAGAVLSWVRPARARPIALVAQTFALLGTIVGVFTIAIGSALAPRRTSPTTPPFWRRSSQAWCSPRERGGMRDERDGTTDWARGGLS